VNYYICVCYHQNLIIHKNGFNKFPLFDDDKPNDHIDIKDKHKLVPNQSSQRREKILKKATQAKSYQNNHCHAHLPPFGVIEKE